MRKILGQSKFSIIKKSIIVWAGIKSIGKAFKRETVETKVASKILLKLLKGKEVTPEEIKFLKSQSADLGKAIAIIGLQAVPGSSIAIVAIEKAGQKYGFTLFPQAQILPSENKTPASVE